MKIAASITVTAGVVGPDPETNPADVPEGALLRVPDRRSPFDVPILATYLALAAGAAETVTVEVWAADESTLTGPPADRKFYRVLTALVLTANRLQLLSPFAAALAPMPSGVLYLRQTADTLATEGTIGAVPV